MRHLAVLLTFAGTTLPSLHAASPGSGSPSPQVQQSFINAYNRGQFPLLTAGAINDVHSFGSPGLVQEFTSRANSNLKFALIKPDPSVPVSQFDTLQMYGDLYAYYLTIGQGTAGYPAIDTTPCPVNGLGTCNYQLFTKNYGLFVYSSPSLNLAIRDPFYTEWNNGGGISGSFGLVTGAETAVTSISKVQGTQQLFATGSIYSYPTGATTPSVYGLTEPFNSAYNAAGSFAALGFPTSEVRVVDATGLQRQTFEGGRIEMMPSGTPIVLFPVSEVDITFASTGLTVAQGASAMISATVLDTRGVQVSGRTLTWSTTNGTVAGVQGNGLTATVLGVAAGVAQIYATAEGKTSAPIVVHVGSGCCAIGEGAPTQAISQAFQDAVTRNHLAVLLPAAATVARVGTGYVQTLNASDGSGTTYAIAEADGSTMAFLLTGGIYAAYLQNGGFTGSLGYPASDPLPGGAQKFLRGAALAGTPVRLVPATLAAKWFLTGGPGGALGSPASDATAFTSPTGVTGVSQAFVDGALFGTIGGQQNGQAFVSSGLILARYLALSGPAGALGVPLSDVTVNGGVQTETFEGGYIDLQPGAAAAVEHYNPRHPALSPTPATVAPGGRVHISASGFAPGATLAFTITGQPGFSVQTPSGVYQWDIVIPLGAKPGTVTIQVQAPGSSDVASGSYTISSVPALLPKLSILSGDRQTGMPGSLLKIVALLQDSGGNPLAGVPVFGTGSPGSSLQIASASDANGLIAANFRLPPAVGVAVGSLSAGGQVVEFSALAAASSLANFPVFTQTDQQGGLVAALASVIRFYQNSGTLAVPNGLATPAALNQFLAMHSGYVASENGDLIANPWSAAGFAGSTLNLSVAAGDLNQIIDLLAAGSPVVLTLNLKVDGAAGGSAVVDVIGVNGDGSIMIADPNPAFGRSSLADYLHGFSAQGHAIQATLGASIVISPAKSLGTASAFVVASKVSAGAAMSSPAGSCGSADFFDPAIAGQAAVAPGGVRFQYCDGTQPQYEIDFVSPKGAVITDLSAGGSLSAIPASTGSAFQVIRSNAGGLQIAPQTLTIGGVTDAAAFAPGLSPGGIFSIFGTGLASAPAVTVGGKNAQITAAFPYQVNAVMPSGAVPGDATLQVTSALGTATRSIAISLAAPGIFVIGTTPDGRVQGAIVNQDGAINSPAFPAQRGQFVSIYCTGLGATAAKAGFQQVTAPVTAILNGTPVTPSFSGLAPGFVGLYQVNVPVPAGLPPSLTGALQLEESGQVSNTVAFALQ